MRRVTSEWISAFRPKTLTAAIAPILVGTALTKLTGHQAIWWVSVLSLLASIFIQVGTNLVNDAVDFKKGADTDARVGPKRVTQSGVFSGRTVMLMAALFFILAVFCGIPLVVRGGLPILWIGIFSVLAGYAYTAGPFPLAYKGLGDIFVIIFFGLVAVGGVSYLHSFTWSLKALVLGFQVGFHCTVLIAINNLRDVETDRFVNKKTLPVRFGKTFARYEIAFLCFVPFFMQVYWWQQGLNKLAFLPLLALPLAINIVISVFKHQPGPIYNKFLGKAAGLHLIFSILLTIGFYL